ncbi:uncharacterized protein ALTATR162_LOCUS6513 [Alternaria atra]|uniref:Uncharacterized protein n=1 Tax=Alternaria atra TaxID=119953 RepID=A0A8J2I4E0_9PLEO|nr:uncharacterized protein ALTATR162_LOCUS6513 [Alternaria atra]CAG5163645.1 unnamed protein product [Alternaria atra]
MGYHDVAGHGKQRTSQGNEMQIPPQANVLAAASHVRRLFESKKFTYAIMGELAMLCLGYKCEIRDVFIAYDDKDYNRIKKKLEADRRVRLPEGMNPLFPSKMVVQTGPSFLDTGCTRPATIEVYLVPSGSYETPSNGTLAKNLVLLSLRADGVLRTFQGLNMIYLVRTLLHFCQIRGLAWEPRNGIHFLCQHYGDQLQSIRSQLNLDSIERNFLRTGENLHQPPYWPLRQQKEITLGRSPLLGHREPKESLAPHYRTSYVHQSPRRSNHLNRVRHTRPRRSWSILDFLPIQREIHGLGTEYPVPQAADILVPQILSLDPTHKFSHRM